LPAEPIRVYHAALRQAVDPWQPVDKTRGFALPFPSGNVAMICVARQFVRPNGSQQ